MTEPRQIAQPQPGYFVIRLVKGGPLAPARIWRPCTCTVNGPGDDAIDPNARHEWRETCDRYPLLVAEVDGKPADLTRLWNTVCARLGTVDQITDLIVSNMLGRWVMEITREEYEFACQDTAWCREYDPDQAMKTVADFYRVDQMRPIF